MIRALMLGAGTRELKRDIESPGSKPVDEWVTLDVQGSPDVKFDLDRLCDGDKLPFPDEHFDELHAYEVLEHIGRQGNWRGWFTEFKEYWRILKPGKPFFISAPHDDKVFSTDPGHTRCVSQAHLMFMTRWFYENNKHTVATDYSSYVDPCWWQFVKVPVEDFDRQFFVMVKAK